MSTAATASIVKNSEDEKEVSVLWFLSLRLFFVQTSKCQLSDGMPDASSAVCRHKCPGWIFLPVHYCRVVAKLFMMLDSHLEGGPQFNYSMKIQHRFTNGPCFKWHLCWALAAVVVRPMFAGPGKESEREHKKAPLFIETLAGFHNVTSTLLSVFYRHCGVKCLQVKLKKEAYGMLYPAICQNVFIQTEYFYYSELA